MAATVLDGHAAAGGAGACGACLVQLRTLGAAALQEATHSSDEAKPEAGAPAEVPAELEPLLRGAWLNSPLSSRTSRRLFFQLSEDASTLRWSWTEFLRVYLVEEIASNRDLDKLTITITTASDRDLVLKFDKLQR
jgi:hypothetical protein